MPRQVDFKVPKINCEDGDEVPYTDCEEAEKIQMITKMTCEVKHTTDCKPVVSTKCGNVQYQVGDILDTVVISSRSTENIVCTHLKQNEFRFYIYQAILKRFFTLSERILNKVTFYVSSST